MTGITLPAGDKPHRRILASAGCGKTYNLAGRFLELVHRGAEPRTIWASTFSRAAAAEIRDRVLRWAAEAVLDATSRARLAGAMEVAEFDAEASASLLVRLVEALPFLEIRTLDSMFAGITISCAAELGLPVESRMLEEGEARGLLRAAIHRVLEDTGAEDALVTLTSLSLGQPASGILRYFEGLVSELLALVEGAKEGAWDWEVPQGPPRDHVAGLIADLGRLRDGLSAKRLLSTVAKDVELALDALAQGGLAWRAFLDRGLASKVASGDELYYGKPIPDDLVAAYRPLIDYARLSCQRAYMEATHAARDFARGVLHEVEAEKRRRGVLDFADLTRALDPDRGAGVPLDEVWFRIDNRAMHMLLDEFQDTSAAQWRAVRPIAGEIALTQDGSRSLFAVGDVKQSIYGWRGGEPRILDELEHVTSPPDPVEFDSRPLNHSYRSSLSVIAAVNAVFDDIGRNRAVVAASPPAAAEFAKWFGTQSTARIEPGFGLFLDLPPKGDDESAEDVRVRVAVARARDHWLRLRGSGGRIAILVRRNKTVGRLVAALKRQGVPVVGRGGGSLLDTEANLALLQSLHLAAFPEDRAAAFDLAKSPLRGFIGLPQVPGRAACRQASQRLRSWFASRGVASVFDEWRRALDAELGPREVVRMRQLVAAVERLERGADRTPIELLELLSVAKVDDPGHGAVTVLNVHQSKGLEYDVVIVTDLGESIVPMPARQKIVTQASSDPAGRLVRVSRAVAEPLRWCEVSALHDDEQRRSVREALCVLYVALTRARDGLEVHLEPLARLKSGEESADSSRSLAAVCRESLGEPEEGAAEIEGCTVRWRHGHLAPAPDAVDALDREESEADEPISPAPRLQVVGGHRTRRARAASRQAGAEERQRLFELPPRDALDRGQALHAAFELVGFVGEDPLPTDESVDLKIAAACPGRDAEWRRERIAEFRDAIEADEVRAALARPGPDAELRREHAFLRVLGGAVQEGAIDRLVLERDADGRVLRAEVLDYKSGSTVDPAALDQKHGDQLRAYRDVVVEQFGVDPAAVRLCILAIGGRRLVEIG